MADLEGRFRLIPRLLKPEIVPSCETLVVPVPVRTVSLLAVAAFVLSGCVAGPGGGLDSAPSTITRHFTLTLDEATMKSADRANGVQETLATFIRVGFDYTHAGSTTPTSELSATYLSRAGLNVTVPLSDFTLLPALARGTVVTILPGQGGTPEADLLTGMQVAQGTKTLFAREDETKAWMTVQGMPIPLAFSEAGAAKWNFEVGTKFGANFDGLVVVSTDQVCDYTGQEYTCEPRTETVQVDLAEMSLDYGLKGTLEAIASQPAAGPRLRLAAQLDGLMAVDVAVDARIDGERMQGTMDADFALEVRNTYMDMQFDHARDLRSITTAAQVFVDGTLVVTGDAEDVPDLPSPILDERFGPETETLSPARSVDATMVDLLNRLWALDLAVGDRIAIKVDMPGDTFMPAIRMDYTSQVLGSEPRKVGGVDRSTFRVSDALNVEVGQGVSTWEWGYDQTYWVDAETSLPVHMQGRFDRTFHHDDIVELLDTMRMVSDDDFPRFTVPADAQFTVSADVTMSLDADTTDLATAAIMATSGGRTIPMAAMVFVLVQNMA